MLLVQGVRDRQVMLPRTPDRNPRCEMNESEPKICEYCKFKMLAVLQSDLFVRRTSEISQNMFPGMEG